MNIWVEYFRYEDNRKNTWAQIRENPNGIHLTQIKFQEDFVKLENKPKHLLKVCKNRDTTQQLKRMEFINYD